MTSTHWLYISNTKYVSGASTFSAGEVRILYSNTIFTLAVLLTLSLYRGESWWSEVVGT